MELLHKLGIDWKLLIAQIVNFAVLLFILAKFVYRPVLEMLEKRSRTIEEGLKNAKAADDRLAEAMKMQQEKMAEASREVGQMLDRAKADAEAMKNEIVVAAHAQAEDLARRTKLQLAEEKEKMLQEVKQEASAFVLLAARKILDREFSQDDQKRLMDTVIKEMHSVSSSISA